MWKRRLQARRVRGARLRPVAANPATGSPDMGGNIEHTPYRVTSVGHAFTKATERAKLDGVTFHTLRHTCVSRLINSGKPEQKIGRMIGHSTTSMTDRYTHLRPGDLRELVATSSRKVGPYPAQKVVANG